LVGADSAPMGAMRAMASEILAEWGLARTLADFWVWLGRDAPSEDPGMRTPRRAAARHLKGRLLIAVGLMSVLASSTTAGTHERFRVQGYVQWIAGSKMVVVTDDGVSLALDLTEADSKGIEQRPFGVSFGH